MYVQGKVQIIIICENLLCNIYIFNLHVLDQMWLIAKVNSVLNLVEMTVNINELGYVAGLYFRL